MNLKELQDYVETSYQKTQQLESDQEELRRILGFTATVGDVARETYTYLVYPNEQQRAATESAFMAHAISFLGMVSYYDMNFKELLERAQDAITKTLGGTDENSEDA